MDAWALLDDQGDEVKVEIKVSGDDTQLAKGIVLILPSSGPDMRDEEYYAQNILGMGFASAVVYGADPRYSSKFQHLTPAICRRVTQPRRWNFWTKRLVLAASLLSLAPHRAALLPCANGTLSGELSIPVQDFAHCHVQRRCPDSLEVPVSSQAKIITFNGRWDNAIPLVCANMKASLRLRSRPWCMMAVTISSPPSIKDQRRETPAGKLRHHRARQS